MEELSGDWEKHLDLCSDRQWAENANKACCLLPLYDLRYNRDIQVFCEHFAVKEMFHWLLLPQGIPTTCSVSMANPWVCSHGWGDKVYFFEKKSNLIPRYTLWIPLYPLGFICEGVIALRNIPYFEETDRFVSPLDYGYKKYSCNHHRFSILLPNKWNVSFYFPNVIRFYLLFGFFPMLYTQMWHMYQLR